MILDIGSVLFLVPFKTEVVHNNCLHNTQMCTQTQPFSDFCLLRFDAGLTCGGDVGETADVGRVQFQLLGVLLDLPTHTVYLAGHLLDGSVQ